jgi:hypothetical protein
VGTLGFRLDLILGDAEEGHGYPCGVGIEGVDVDGEQIPDHPGGEILIVDQEGHGILSRGRGGTRCGFPFPTKWYRLQGGAALALRPRSHPGDKIVGCRQR